MDPAYRQLRDRLRPPGPAEDRFDPAEVADLPHPVRDFLTAAIAPGTPLATAAELRMRGSIRLGRWVPFRAAQVLAPHAGMVWTARAAGIRGSDRYLDGRGVADWRVAGLVPVMHADGPDTDRAAAGRCAAEALWVPTALLPRHGVSWEAPGDRHVVASLSLDATPVELHLHLDVRALPVRLTFRRWGDPDETGTAGWHPFGGEVTSWARFGGVTLPSAGELGWFHGTDRWPDGAFFRYRLTRYRLLVDR
jgi:hypothetical protein